MSAATLPGLSLGLDEQELCTPEEEAVLAELRQHRGREAAIPTPELAKRCGLTTRRAQHVMDHLVFDHSVPIGSAMSAPAGNYLIVSGEDLDATVRLLTTRSLHGLARASRLRRTALRAWLNHVQHNLDLYYEGASK